MSASPWRPRSHRAEVHRRESHLQAMSAPRADSRVSAEASTWPASIDRISMAAKGGTPAVIGTDASAGPGRQPAAGGRRARDESPTAARAATAFSPNSIIRSTPSGPSGS